MSDFSSNKFSIYKALIIISAIIHVFEEYFGGFLCFVSRLVTGFTLTHFIIINVLFIVYTSVSLFTNKQILFLSVPFLLFINAIIHISGTIIFRTYNPGVITSILFYLPIFILSIYYIKPKADVMIKSFFLAATIMTFPFVFQLIRLTIHKII